MRTMGDSSDSEDDHAEGVHGADGEDDEEEARPDLAEDVERFQIHAGGSLIPPSLLSMCRPLIVYPRLPLCIGLPFFVLSPCVSLHFSPASLACVCRTWLKGPVFTVPPFSFVRCLMARCVVARECVRACLCSGCCLWGYGHPRGRHSGGGRCCTAVQVRGVVLGLGARTEGQQG
jgi:hypothetical protein